MIVYTATNGLEIVRGKRDIKTLVLNLVMEYWMNDDIDDMPATLFHFQLASTSATYLPGQALTRQLLVSRLCQEARPASCRTC